MSMTIHQKTPHSPARLQLQISFGAILTPIGIFLLTYGFGSFFQLLPGADIAAILLIYGFPLTLLGFALSYAQLKPVPCKTTKDALALRDAQATDIQKQVPSALSRTLKIDPCDVSSHQMGTTEKGRECSHSNPSSSCAGKRRQ